MLNVNTDFFKKLKNDKADLKKIKKAIITQSVLSKKKTEEHLIMLLNKYGKVLKNDVEENVDFQQAFLLAEDWNYYELQNADMQKLKNWINRGLIKVSAGEMIINKETWGWLACLAYLKAAPKESPNHFFLKYLLELYFKKYCSDCELKKELSSVFTKKIRYDLYLQDEGRIIVGEVGGVQVWKVMAALEQGFDIMVIPHWTADKKYPFVNYKLEYKIFWFQILNNGSNNGKIK